MIQHLYIGPCPSDEDCAQIGVTEGAERLNRLECEAYIEALRRVYGQEPEGAFLEVKSQGHDLGIYREVVCYYDDNVREAIEYAFKVETGLGTWAEADMLIPIFYDLNSQPVGVAA